MAQTIIRIFPSIKLFFILVSKNDLSLNIDLWNYSLIFKVITKVKNSTPTLTPQALTELKDKLKKKYFLLRNEDLPEINRVDLITHVCSKLGMTKLDLEWVIKDL